MNSSIGLSTISNLGNVVTVIVQGITTLEASAKQELRAALAAYGAAPDLVENARVMPVAQDASEYMSQQLQEVRVRLWIDEETGLVRRMAIGQGSSNTDEGVVGFWGYGENMQLSLSQKSPRPCLRQNCATTGVTIPESTATYDYQ